MAKSMNFSLINPLSIQNVIKDKIEKIESSVKIRKTVSEKEKEKVEKKEKLYVCYDCGG